MIVSTSDTHLSPTIYVGLPQMTGCAHIKRRGWRARGAILRQKRTILPVGV
jgi:hypothetical protein